MTTMNVTAARKNGQDGKGVVLYGSDESGKWFERWFADAEKAVSHATRKGWKVVAE